MTGKARVQEIGGVLMLELPEQMRGEMQLRSGAEIDVEFGSEGVKLKRPLLRYDLQELLDQCDPEAEISDEDRQWEQMSPMGRELL